MVAEATLEAERQDPEHAKRWVVLVDGAEPQLDLVEAGAAAYGVDVTVVLDIIHVVEYVWKAGHVFHREGSPELAHWAWTRVRSILEGKARQVAAAMRRAATVAGFSKDTRKPVDRCADYLLKYAPYLHYDRYLAAGYPIATGVIEGACRYLVRDRMELTGARWRLVGAEAVLKLRALRASGDFDAYWDSTKRGSTSGTTPSATRMGQYRRSPSRPHRPPHRVFDGSSNSCHAARRNPLGRRRRRAAPISDTLHEGGSGRRARCRNTRLGGGVRFAARPRPEAETVRGSMPGAQRQFGNGEGATRPEKSYDDCPASAA